jgi:hypothetical protein
MTMSIPNVADEYQHAAMRSLALFAFCNASVSLVEYCQTQSDLLTGVTRA